MILTNLKASIDGSLESTGCPATVSIGVVTFNHLPESVDDLLRHADRTMYALKASGKNAIAFKSA